MGTYYSGMQILLISACCFFISDVMRRSRSLEVLKARKIWNLATIGFFYLFLDEVAQLHEKIDFAIHFVFSIQETEITDMIDDGVLLLMVIFGGVFLLVNGRVFLKDFGYKKTYAFAFFLIILMVIVDMSFIHLVDLFIDTLGEEAHLRLIHFGHVLEDSLKIWGGTCLLIAVSGTLIQKRALYQSAEKG